MTAGAAHLFDVPSGGISLAGGVPDLSPIEMRGLSEQVGRQIRLGGPTILQYSTMETPSDLVEAIEDLAGRESMHPLASNLVPTSGSQLGLVAVCRALVADGEYIAAEELTYPGALSAFAWCGARVAPVPMDEEGLVPEALVERLGAGSTCCTRCQPSTTRPGAPRARAGGRGSSRPARRSTCT